MIDITTIVIVLGVFATSSAIIYFIWKYLIPKLQSLTSSSTEVKTKRIKNIDTSIELLKLEFEYAKESSIQAQQDRLTIMNFYLGLYTAINGGYIGIQQIVPENVIEYLPLTFLVLSFLSYIFILQIIRLRQAWHESAMVMNQIKEYFFKRDESLKDFITWRIDTLPKPEKFKTINYFTSFLIAILGSISLAIGLTLFSVPILLNVLITLLYLVICLGSYRFMLEYNV
ncbi:hypothetical protein KC669_04585 [Candidatus Dojkabacteria bacterium]|uniref:Uncharacterized protein n=1 Tax=Candidatus Dojkabacteria bacterium TaxID=2099670 RepID=A0A955RME9_9BACT|nr:hypothetical protein [Candidatus Dojkabacteria bacterium]